MKLSEITAVADIAPFVSKLGNDEEIVVKRRPYPFKDEESDVDESAHKVDISKGPFKESDLDNINPGDTVFYNGKVVTIRKMIFDYAKNTVTFKLPDKQVVSAMVK